MVASVLLMNNSAEGFNVSGFFFDNSDGEGEYLVMVNAL